MYLIINNQIHKYITEMFHNKELIKFIERIINELLDKEIYNYDNVKETLDLLYEWEKNI